MTAATNASAELLAGGLAVSRQHGPSLDEVSAPAAEIPSRPACPATVDRTQVGDDPTSSSLIDPDQAEVFATWFQALSDSTRILILNLLSVSGRPVSVATIADTLGLPQSTTSHHLRVLHETTFVQRQRQGTSMLYRVNADCLESFPSAADMVMGRYRARLRSASPQWAGGQSDSVEIEP